MHGQANRPARKPGKGPELDQHMLVENATPQGHRGHVDDMETHPENEDQGQCAGEPGDASAEATAQLEGVDDGAQCSQQGHAGQRDQNPERQLEQVHVDKVFTDKASGKDTQRPELDLLLTSVLLGHTFQIPDAAPVRGKVDRWTDKNPVLTARARQTPSLQPHYR